MVKVKRVEIHEDFPTSGEAYAILTDGERFAFAWGPKLPWADEVPEKDVQDGESGIEWYFSERAARQAMFKTFDAWVDIWGN